MSFRQPNMQRHKTRLRPKADQRQRDEDRSHGFRGLLQQLERGNYRRAQRRWRDRRDCGSDRSRAADDGLQEGGTLDHVGCEFRSRDGRPLDLQQRFTLADDRDEMSHFLRTTGYLVVKRAFEPELIRELRTLMPNETINLNDVVQLQIHSASPAYIRGMQDQFDDLSVHDLIQMRIHGTTAEYVQQVQGSFDQNATMHDIVQLRIHGASADYIADMQSMLSDDELTAHDITQMRIHGVSLELVRELQDDGYENLTANDLVQMKIHGFDRWLKRRGGR